MEEKLTEDQMLAIATRLLGEDLAVADGTDRAWGLNLPQVDENLHASVMVDTQPEADKRDRMMGGTYKTTYLIVDKSNGSYLMRDIFDSGWCGTGMINELCEFLDDFDKGMRSEVEE